MNILVVSSYLPFPLYSGGHIRLYNLLKRLAKKHHITLICEQRSYQTAQDLAAVKEICDEVITIPRKKQWSVSNITKTALSQSPFLVTGHTSLSMRLMIEQLLLQKSFDLIHVETSYVMQNVPPTKIPILLVEHNIEYLVYQRYAQNVIGFLKSILQVDVNKLRRFEEDLWAHATAVAAVSDQEKDIIAKVTPNVSVIPNGVDLDTFILHKKDPQRKERKLLFIGDFKWIQNQDIALWILQEIWPNILQQIKNKNVVLWIVGRNIPRTLRKYKENRIIFQENISDTAKAFQEADILLAPIRVGGGTSYKILEAMASGTPVVTTALGAEGIQGKQHHEVLVGNTTQEIVQQILHLLRDEKLYTTQVKQAREKVENTYSWDRISDDLHKLYLRVGK